MEVEIRGYKGKIQYLQCDNGASSPEYTIQIKIWNGTITLYHVKEEEIKVIKKESK